MESMGKVWWVEVNKLSLFGGGKVLQNYGRSKEKGIHSLTTTAYLLYATIDILSNCSWSDPQYLFYFQYTQPCTPWELDLTSSKSQLYRNTAFSYSKMTAENNDYQSIFVKYSRKYQTLLFCCDFSNNFPPHLRPNPLARMNSTDTNSSISHESQEVQCSCTYV